MNAPTQNSPVAEAGETLIEHLEGFIDDASTILEKEKLRAHVKAMHKALAVLDRPEPSKHTAAAGLC
jgi:hypothetical protein